MTRSPLPDPIYDAAYYEGVLPKRLFAWVIDAGLVFSAMLILSVLTVGIAFMLWIPVHFALAFFYRWSTLKAKSATLGMRLMNIELRGPGGAPLTSAEAALHTGSFLVSATFFFIQLVSIGMMIGRPYNRGLPDEIVGSVMINRPV
ncbi:RDD family protein [Rhodobacteraceae bacterium N5(2021)]|uniref:RDD family protein n=1 Tax=Gymnodinialimonas phycosphaerae TaxID=2841589 RepID=A0A975TXD8_9RHOB|nr:RDD family protein [Gymnodinialimonas phycosphaerae]MBY4891705.1 RDD family protein [Gymnodinialimonas phycosphaerae]